MVWLVGCNGMLGNEIKRQFEENGIEYTGTDREVDFTDIEAINSFTEGKKIDFIVNCAAYTAVDKAESEEAFAEKLNADGPRNLSIAANKLDATLIHISTDYVFDGTGNSPRTEDMEIAPIGVYGVTKAHGEKAVIENAKKHFILRTAWLYGWMGKNFVYTMIRAMNSHDAVKVVNDQKGTPTFAGDLANVVLKLIKNERTLENKKDIPYGIYHVTDIGETTWWEFTKEIQKQGIENGWINENGKKCVVNPCTTEEYPTPAKRPLYSVLDKTKIQNALDIKLPDWKESLGVFLKSSFFDEEKIK